MISNEADHARGLDDQDELRAFRDRFVFSDPRLIYLDGNSLGRLPKAAVELSRALVEREWGERLIRSWNESWLGLPERIGGKIARLIGAGADEVIVADSTSVNLFKLALAALRVNAHRLKIVTDDLNFPSDVYVLQAVANLVGRGRTLEVVRSPDGVSMPMDRLHAAIDADTALVSLSHVSFKSGFAYDLSAVTDVAHRARAVVLWDFSHSVGVMPIDLALVGADLAVGCTYKYLNGGPGAPAFLYVRRDWQDVALNPLAGWFGHADPFDFGLDYRPAAGLRRFLTGTPPVLSLAPIEPGVDLVLEAGLDRIRAKSVRQTEFLIELWEEHLKPLGFALNSPREARRRGSHVSLGHDDAYRIDQALIHRFQIIPDFRPPDNLRLGVCPLSTTFAELHATVIALRQIVLERLYEQYPCDRRGVP